MESENWKAGNADEHVRGSLDEIRVPEILHNISRRKLTGALHIHRSHQKKTIYFEEGKIVFAASNDPDDRLGVLLLRRSKVTYRQLQECAPKVVPGKRLGTVLVLEGLIQPNELYLGVVDQIKEIIYSVFDWEAGAFQFLPGPLPEKEVITLNLSTSDLIASGVQRIWRWSWIRHALPALDTVYRKSEGWSPIVRKMNLTREMEGILDLFDRPRTLEEVLQISALGNFETARLIWTFLILGIIEEILVAPQWTHDQEDSVSQVPERTALPIEPVGPLQDVILTETKDPLPAGFAKESPTLKIQPKDNPQTEKMAVPSLSENLEPLLAEPVPFSELSFSDLAELTDSADAKDEPVPQESPALQPWETSIEPELKQFNELHRYLYEMISLELGNGTGTFLSKVFKKATTRYPMVFESVSVNEFGELGESVLMENIQGNLVQDYKTALDYLMAEERSMMSLFLEMKRVDVIEAGLKRILQRQNRNGN